MRFLKIAVCTIVHGRSPSIPTDLLVHLSDIETHSLFGFSASNISLVDHYVNSMHEHLRNLGNTVREGEGFHLDALYYSLKNQVKHAKDLEARAVKSQIPETLDEEGYAYIISTANANNQPGINLSKATTDKIHEYRSDLKHNGGILYVDSIFDEITFTKVRNPECTIIYTML